MITVKFFARLRDQLGQAELQMSAANIGKLADVESALLKLNPQWQGALADQNLLVAVNQTMGNKNSPVQDGDEVAFFPPVTGG